MTAAAELWRSLREETRSGETGTPPEDGFNAENVATGLWVAIDHDLNPFLLVELAEGASSPETRSRVLRSRTGPTEVPGQPGTHFLTQLWIEDERFLGVFGAFSDRVITELEPLPMSDRAERLAGILGLWRHFWGSPGQQLRPEDELGLLGELIFIADWLTDRRNAVTTWTGTGSSSTTRDFETPVFDVEVKTTQLRPVGTHHRINGLRQLDPDGGKPLYLFSCTVSPSGDADLDIQQLVDRILSDISGDPELTDAFLGKLAGRGFSPGNRELRTFRLERQGLFRIEGDFPRLTESSIRGGLPEGIPSGGVTYSLDMAACANWLLSEDPQSPESLDALNIVPRSMGEREQT